MYPLSDNELDRLSRDASDQFDVPQKTSGWEVLEEKLNREMPLMEKQKRRRFLFLLLFFVIAGGAGISGIILWNPNNPSSLLPNTNGSDPGSAQTTAKDRKSNHPDINEKSNAEKVLNPEFKPGINPESLPSETTPPTANDAEFHSENTEKTEIGKNPSEPPALTTERDSDNNHFRPGHKNKIRTTNPATPDLIPAKSKNFTKSPAPDPGISGSDLLIMTHSYNRYLIPLTIAAPINSSSLLNPDSIHYREVFNEVKPLPATPLAKLKPVQSEKGFQLGIVAAPDKTNVGSTRTKETGFNYGAIASYRFTKRWSLNTGFIYTRKIYSATGRDYKPPKDYWTYNVNLGTVNGDCYMFDIPFNLRYDLMRKTKTSVFANTGLSTYLMRKETYDYHYTYNGVYASQERTYKTNKVQLFSVINASVGIEQAINRKWSLQLEPYIKIPAKGLGFGSIKLNSYGAYLSLRYKLYR